MTAVTLSGGAGVAIESAGPVAPADATGYVWVGTTQHGDGNSWIDPENWQPQGIPTDGDSVVIRPVGDTCRLFLAVHTPITLVDFTLAGFAPDCQVSLYGGPDVMTVTGNLNWGGGSIGFPITLAPAGRATLTGYGQPTRIGTAQLRVEGTLILDDGWLSLSSDGLLIAPGGHLKGNGVVHGPVVNRGGLVEVSGGEKLNLVDSYTQRHAGTLKFDIGESPAYLSSFYLSVRGAVVYHHLAAPHYGQITYLFSSMTAIGWHPSCATTTGPGARTGHWEALLTDPLTGLIRGQFRRSPAPTC